MNQVTLRELAAHLGLGKSTVQRALSGSSKVKKSTRERVEKAAREMGYQPDLYFATLSGHRRRVGKNLLRVCYLTHKSVRRRPAKKGVEYFSLLNNCAASKGFEVFCVEVEDRSRPEMILRQIWQKGASGILVGDLSEPMTEALRGFNKLPVICLIRDPHLPFHTVRFSVGQALRLCWTQLQARGYQRIGCAVQRHDPELPDDVDRLGAALAMSTRSYPSEERIPPLCDLLHDPKGFSHWLQRYEPDAVIGYNAGLWWQCKNKHGAQIPFACLHASPDPVNRHISGSREDYRLQVELSFRQLDVLIRNGEVGIPVQNDHLVIDTFWQEGTSTPFV
ncbi:LacI family DNA-binding transcriptional regulator [Kiritimatiellaeota bacterium B1221]|nr:LacI family DNA-binding transcriptional regulator [Kiritimatiellaeota bacterium B1221]